MHAQGKITEKLIARFSGTPLFHHRFRAAAMDVTRMLFRRPSHRKLAVLVLVLCKTMLEHEATVIG